MKITIKPLLAAGVMLAGLSPVVAAPAAAQIVKGIGVASLPAIVANSNAYKTAEAQRPTTYKPQIDQANARGAAIEAQLKPLIDKFNADRQANPQNPSLEQQYNAIQQIRQAGQQEIQQMIAPVALSRAYVTEQITDQLNTAVQNAAKKKNIQLVLDSSQGDVLFASEAYNINQDVLNELNTLLPNAQLVPPQGWLPREIREQQAAAAGQNGQAPAGQTTTPPATNSR
jgi:Skp family chaperone for outer membrane proteins